MSSIKKERNQDISDFHDLCKDLFKFLKRRIIKKYVFPQIASFYEETPKFWKYCKNENVTEDERICNLFKDNSFLRPVQKFYESLEIILNILDVNKTNFEKSKKEIEVEERKIGLLFELNNQLNKFFNIGADISLNQKNKINEKINKQNIIGNISLIKLHNILKDLKKINFINSLDNQENDNDNNNNNSSEINIAYDNSIIIENNYNNNELISNYKNAKSIKHNNDEEDEIRASNEIPVEDLSNINKRYNNNEFFNDSKKEFEFLNKKKKRDKDINRKKEKEKYINVYDDNLIDLNEDKSIIKEIHSNIEDIENYQNKNIKKEDNENIYLSESIKSEKDVYNSNISSNNDSIFIYSDNSDIEFEKELKKQFYCVFSNSKYLQSNGDIILEINKILKKNS